MINRSDYRIVAVHRDSGDHVHIEWAELADIVHDASSHTGSMDLNDVKKQAVSTIERMAAAARGIYMTAGKDAVYIQKQREAVAILDDPSPTTMIAHPTTGIDVPKYNHLRAMVGLWVHDTGDLSNDLLSAAKFVLGRAEDAKAVTAAIERTADLAKRDVATAQTTSAVDDVVSAIQWP